MWRGGPAHEEGGWTAGVTTPAAPEAIAAARSPRSCVPTRAGTPAARFTSAKEKALMPRMSGIMRTPMRRARFGDAIVEEAVPMAGRGSGGNTGGIGLGGVLVIVGIVLMIVWSFWLGLIILLVGLIAFGGFAKGKWY
jgi:hypothetical protein